MGAPDVLEQAGALTLPPGLDERPAPRDRGGAPGRRLRRVRRGAALLPPGRAARRGWRRWPWSCSKRRCAPTPRRRSPTMREQEVDLKLISGDARETVSAVASAVGIPADAGTIEGSELPEDAAGLAEAARGEHDLLPDRPRAEEGAGRGAARVGALHGDDRRRGQRRAGAEAGAAGGGDGLRRPGDQRGRRRRPARGRVRAAAGSGRRRAADRPQHPPPRPALPDQDGLRGGADPARRRARLRLPVPAQAPDPGRLPDDRHPLLRPRPGALRRAALPRAPDAGAGRLRGPGRARHGARLDPLLLPRRHDVRRLAGRRAGPRRRRP